MKTFSRLFILVLLTCGATAWGNSSDPVIQLTVQGDRPLGYDAMFWQVNLESNSTSTANLFSGGGTFYQDSLTTKPILDVGFVGLFGTFDGVTFDPAGVAFAATPSAATDILNSQKSFSTVFGEPEQNFITDIQTPITGLSIPGFFHWYDAEGADVPLGVQGTLLYFPVATGAPESGGTFQPTMSSVGDPAAPEPRGLWIIALLGLSLLLVRHRKGRENFPSSS